MSDIHVTYDGDTHWLQCFSDDPSAEKGIIVDPIDVGDSWATLAEKVAEHEAQHGCSPVDEDAPGNEPAKVIVVTEAGGREVSYRADWTDTEDGNLQVIREDAGAIVVAQYAPGYFKRAYRTDALLTDDASRLGIARLALREIAGSDEENPADAAARARQALEDIAELDL